MFDRLFDCARLDRTPRVTNWSLAVLLAAVAVGATSCGSGDTAADSRDQPASTGNVEREAAEPVSDKAQVRQLVDDLQANYIAGDGAGYCAGLTGHGRKEIADVAKAFNLGTTCEDFIAKTSRMTRKAKVKQKPTVVLAVQIKGRRAIATVSDGGRAAIRMAFVKRGDEWKLPDAGIKKALLGNRTNAPPPGSTQSQ